MVGAKAAVRLMTKAAQLFLVLISFNNRALFFRQIQGSGTVFLGKCKYIKILYSYYNCYVVS